MEIKVKKEKEPELKLKKEAQVTVHKKNPILSAKEKKAAFTSKPVADLLGQRKKKEGAEKGKQPEQGREVLFEKQKEKKKQAGKEAAIRGAAEDRKQNGKAKSTVSVPGTLQPDQMKQGAAPNSQPAAGFRAKEQYRREQAAKLAETKKSSLAKQTAIKGVRRGEAAILTQLEGGEEVNDSLYVMGTAAKPAEKLWKDRDYRKAERELKVKQADGKITNKQFYKETKAVKKKQMPTALAASAVLTVGIHPLYLYDGGFWLSFGAVFAVCTVIPVLENEMRCKSLCAGLGINVLLWPVILYNFFEIPVYSILLNLIILPLMSVVLTCGMIGSFIKMAGWIPGKWILWICRCILWVYDKCCVFTIKLPMARWVAGRPDKRRIFIYYLVLMTVILILKFKRNGKKYIISITLYTVGFLILISGPWIRTGAEVTMLDVGQGDCICVEGPEHKTYLIDGGSSDIKNVGKYRIEPFLKYRGIGSIDYVFVSHGDIDHMNGIEEMLKRQQVGIKIRNLVVTGEAYRDEKLEELISVAEDNGTTVWEMENGTQIREGKLRFTCLGPKEKNMNPGNEASMILHLEYEGFDMLFTGDVEKEGEESLTDTLSYLQEKKISWEVLKTAHHGSKNSTTEAFLENVKPRYAWISAGRKNRYGHPHKDTLERLENSGAKIYSTQENGAFGITVNKKSMRIHGRNG